MRLLCCSYASISCSVFMLFSFVCLFVLFYHLLVISFCLYYLCACGVLLARVSLYVKRCFVSPYLFLCFVCCSRFLNCCSSCFNCGVSGFVLLFIVFIGFVLVCCLIVRGFG